MSSGARAYHNPAFVPHETPKFTPLSSLFFYIYPHLVSAQLRTGAVTRVRIRSSDPPGIATKGHKGY